MEGYLRSEYQFKVEISNVGVGYFRDIGGLDGHPDEGVIQYRRGDTWERTPIRMPKDITLRYGFMEGNAFYDLVAKRELGEKETIIVSLFCEEQLMTTWKIINALVGYYEAQNFNATSGDVAIKEVNFLHEGITRIG